MWCHSQVKSIPFRRGPDWIQSNFEVVCRHVLKDMSCLGCLEENFAVYLRVLFANVVNGHIDVRRCVAKER